MQRLELHFPAYLPLKFLVNLSITFIIFVFVFVQLNVNFDQLSVALDRILLTINPRQEDLPELAELRTGIKTAWMISTVLFFIIYVFILYRSVLRFFVDLFLLRRGFYHFKEVKNNSYNSVNYIAAYIGNAYFSYYFFFWVITILLTPFSTPFLYRLAWHYQQYWFSTALFAIINVILDKALDPVFTDETHFKHRRLFQYYDMFRIGTGFLASYGSGIARYVILFLMLFISLYRVDKQSIPRWVSQFFSKNLDLVNMKHNSFLKCYHCHNNPVLHTFVLLLKGKRFRPDEHSQPYTVMEHGLDRVDPEKRAQQRKEREKQEKQRDEAKRAAKADPKGEDSAHKPHERLALRDHAEPSEEQVNRPPRDERHFRIRDGFRRGEFPEVRNKRIAYRFQLLVLLAQNPSLLAYRKSDKVDAERVDGGGDGDCAAKGEGVDANNNVNLLGEKNQRNFYQKKGPARGVHLDDEDFEIRLKKKIQKKRKIKVENSKERKKRLKAEKKKKEKEKKEREKKEKERKRREKKEKKRKQERERKQREERGRRARAKKEKEREEREKKEKKEKERKEREKRQRERQDKERRAKSAIKSKSLKKKPTSKSKSVQKKPTSKSKSAQKKPASKSRSRRDKSQPKERDRSRKTPQKKPKATSQSRKAQSTRKIATPQKKHQPKSLRKIAERKNEHQFSDSDDDLVTSRVNKSRRFR